MKYKPGAYCVAFFNVFNTHTRTEVFPDKSYSECLEYGYSRLNGHDRKGFVACRVMFNSEVSEKEPYDPPQ